MFEKLPHISICTVLLCLRLPKLLRYFPPSLLLLEKRVNNQSIVPMFSLQTYA